MSTVQPNGPSHSPFRASFTIRLVFMTLSLPDTSRWLYKRNHNEQGMQVIAKMSGTGVQDVDVQHAGQEIESLEYEQQRSGSSTFRVSELWQGGPSGNWRRVGPLRGILIMQQATGANMINYYAPVVYQNAMGLSRNVTLQLSGGTSKPD
jgi:hypothetical protein